MGKRIIFCADGTWDTKQNDSNVYKLFQSLPQGPDQIAFYDDGVGAKGNIIEKLVGGAFGEGLFQKIKDGYAKIASVYEPGDEIYIFGFSRGAYTARSLAGMICACGLPTRSADPHLVDTAFDAYRHANHRAEIMHTIPGPPLTKAPIKMIGVWDTVGSLGIPAIFGGVDPLRYGFLDTKLHPNVQNAYQALAIDEHRREFPPTLWTLPHKPVPGQTVEQVWFPGVHGDVGGGYSDTGLSDVTLAWMMDKAQKVGLQIYPAVAAKYEIIEKDAALAAQAAVSPMHHSWNLLWGIPKWRHVPHNATLSNSVDLRAAADKSYRPWNLAKGKTGLSEAYNTAAVVAAPSPAAPQPVQVAAAGPSLPVTKPA